MVIVAGFGDDCEASGGGLLGGLGWWVLARFLVFGCLTLVLGGVMPGFPVFLGFRFAVGLV